jgi:hypothetical protein
MTATTLESGSASEVLYRALRADFDTAYKDMTDSSRAFNTLLMNVTAGLSPEERRVRNIIAAQTYEDAHERFMDAVRKLHEFMIGRIISSRSTIHLVAPQRSIH